MKELNLGMLRQKKPADDNHSIKDCKQDQLLDQNETLTLAEGKHSYDFDNITYLTIN